MLRHFPHGKCGLKYRWGDYNGNGAKSLPSREVWVEIWNQALQRYGADVTSLTGSVGWNLSYLSLYIDFFVTSLTGSVGWNFQWAYKKHHIREVTSLTGSVGWNGLSSLMPASKPGHFPHGKCGLKFLYPARFPVHKTSLPSREVWVEIIVPVLTGLSSASHFPHGKCGLNFPKDSLWCF